MTKVFFSHVMGAPPVSSIIALVLIIIALVVVSVVNNWLSKKEE